MSAPIGKPRVYEPGQHIDIYPGELYHINAIVPREEILLHAQTGFPIELTRHARVTVSPLPGWYGAWLRLKWRLFGRFGIHGLAAITVAFLLASVVAVWVRPSIGIGLSSIGFLFALANLSVHRRRRRFTVDNLKGRH